MMKKNKSGFTLLEIITVVAIISILSAIVLSFLASARGSGKDSAIKASLSQIQRQASSYFNIDDGSGINSGQGTYGVFSLGTGSNCPAATGNSNTNMFDDPKMQAMLVGIYSNIPDPTSPATQTRCRLATTGDAWAVSIKTNAVLAPNQTIPGTIGWWCVDSAGQSKVIDNPIGTVCS